jgi:hypothetical protein
MDVKKTKEKYGFQLIILSFTYTITNMWIHVSNFRSDDFSIFRGRRRTLPHICHETFCYLGVFSDDFWISTVLKCELKSRWPVFDTDKFFDVKNTASDGNCRNDAKLTLHHGNQHLSTQSNSRSTILALLLIFRYGNVKKTKQVLVIFYKIRVFILLVFVVVHRVKIYLRSLFSAFVQSTNQDSIPKVLLFMGTVQKPCKNTTPVA